MIINGPLFGYALGHRHDNKTIDNTNGTYLRFDSVINVACVPKIREWLAAAQFVDKDKNPITDPH
jgi:hypothetical protein